VKILLDTHCLIWLLDDSGRLTPTARRLISQAETVFFSTASIWELGLKWRKGKIDVQPRAIAAAALSVGLQELPIALEAVLISSELETDHGDPFDRLLYAQARHGKLKLLTVDEKIPRFGTAVVRA
jgi:PIN domain nuclease of toxin-antitoxin system